VVCTLLATVTHLTSTLMGDPNHLGGWSALGLLQPRKGKHSRSRPYPPSLN
jgi:hypothetical protein